jgi:hypothetical protein
VLFFGGLGIASADANAGTALLLLPLWDAICALAVENCICLSLGPACEHGGGSAISRSETERIEFFSFDKKKSELDRVFGHFPLSMEEN